MCQGFGERLVFAEVGSRRFMFADLGSLSFVLTDKDSEQVSHRNNFHELAVLDYELRAGDGIRFATYLLRRFKGG